ncbi:MAG: MogA/MoaB family molybdenum cofactor biosynthesis protein [Gemmatimonadaceae bacterium]|nr:MogA/MoaB family molybdenum cofactor biosynthesis protein [Gemmatimonadaceae bacterium]MCW5827558.1 MogA/MoaB family molybdenum cofactor biosynthesis protein [Gemmatimonadaceae bacterium]
MTPASPDSSQAPAGTAAHRSEAAGLGALRCAVLTVSDSRTAATDESGPLARRLLEHAGHEITLHDLLPNDEPRVRALVQDWLARGDLHAIVITGGTGLGSKDRTIEAVTPLFEKEIPGFGELFRLLSYQEQIGTTAILSRAAAGSAKGAVIVSLPGSSKAVELGLSRVLIPELRHLLREIGK